MPPSYEEIMDIADALQIVLDLAKKEYDDNASSVNPKERERQLEAINIVEDMAVNQFGDD